MDSQDENESELNIKRGLYIDLTYMNLKPPYALI